MECPKELLTDAIKILCSIHLKVENSGDLYLISDQFAYRNFLKFNDGAKNLIMEKFNLTLEQL